jgi:acetylornithine deacetylase/succinyl-diaminopimelate desuccinylase-like protein
MKSATDIASALIRIPSVNPDGGDPGTDQTGEAACAIWVADFLRGCGAEVSLREVLPGRPNVVGRFPSRRAAGRRILLAPHLDTVSVSGMTIDPFSGEVLDGCLLGRGASDTKGTAAAMLWALREAQEILADSPYEIWFAGLVGEEAGQFGAKALAAEEQFDFVMAGEPTSLDVVYTHKGSCWLQLRTHGRAVHASQPDTGKNAIYQMMQAIECLRQEGIPRLAANSDPILGTSTLSVGTIRGGSKVNIVPDFCEAAVDIRTIPGMDPEFITDLLRQRVSNIEIDLKRSQPLRTDPSHPLISQLESLGSKLVGAPWFCDAAIFASHGFPSVAIGPGSIAQAHTADEFIRVADLEAGADFFLRFLKSLR